MNREVQLPNPQEYFASVALLTGSDAVTNYRAMGTWTP